MNPNGIARKLAMAILISAMYFLLAAPCALAQERQPELRKLRVLLCIDTFAPRLKDVVQADKGHMLSLLREGIPSDRFTVDLLEGADLTPNNILGYYARLQTAPDEALLFFYVGHGGMDGKEHFLTIEGDSNSRDSFQGVRFYRLGREDVVNALWTKKPGLAIVLTACCSSPIPAYSGTVGAIPPAEAPLQIKPLLRSLFFAHRGIVDITAVPPGESAFGSATGTYFTRNLVDLALHGEPDQFGATDGFVTWKDFHAKLKSRMVADAMLTKTRQEEAVRNGQMKEVQRGFEVQLAYDYQLANEGRVPRPKWRLGIAYDNAIGGVAVTQVFPDTPAAKVGLQVGDLMLSVNNRDVHQTYDVEKFVAESQGKILLRFTRKGSRRVRALEVNLEKVD